MNIQEFYYAIIDLWDQLAIMKSTKLQVFGGTTVSLIFMALRNEFEKLHESILHRSSLPFVDLVVIELLVEEIRF